MCRLFHASPPRLNLVSFPSYNGQRVCGQLEVGELASWTFDDTGRGGEGEEREERERRGRRGRREEEGEERERRGRREGEDRERRGRREEEGEERRRGRRGLGEEDRERRKERKVRVGGEGGVREGGSTALKVSICVGTIYTSFERDEWIDIPQRAVWVDPRHTA